MKKTILSILTLSIFNVISITLNNPVSALTYPEDVEVNFTFSPSLTVSLSSASGSSNGNGTSNAPALVINNLTPGTSSDSNIIDINITTNNVAGYTLFGTVGNSTDTSPSHNTTSLVHSGNGGTFTSLSTNDNVTSLNDFNDNQWGYSYSLDNGTTWSNYSGLPLYSTTGTILKDKHIPGDDSLKFKIAAKSSTTQPSGTYTNTINFTTTANVQDFYFMQDFTNQLCKTLATDNNYTVYDYRDGNDYTVRYINGNCWMTQNLRIAPGVKMTAEDTNITNKQYNNSGHYSLPSEGYDLRADGEEGENCYGLRSGDTYTGASWNSACSHVADSEDVDTVGDSDYTAKQLGAWYNYAAATANTIIGAFGLTTDATYDICPKNWSLPKYDDGATAGSIQSITNYADVFNAEYGGIYNGKGSLTATNRGYWWSSTATNSAGRRSIRYINGVLDNGSGSRAEGYRIRCTISR